jgi:hypothetical protein
MRFLLIGPHFLFGNEISGTAPNSWKQDQQSTGVPKTFFAPSLNFQETAKFLGSNVAD